MNPTIRIALINHTFQINYFSRRWQLFAETHPEIDVTLLAPVEFEWYKAKGYSFGKTSVLRGKELDNGNFHVRTFQIKNHTLIGWNSPDIEGILRAINPDVIYHLGTHNMLSLKQVLKIRNRHLKATKVIAFSMRGPALNLRIKQDRCSFPRWVARRILYVYYKRRLAFINKNVDAFFCHYPAAVECFRREGYIGPVYMQTQVGVNEEWFHEDAVARKEIRDKYGISDNTYVFGSATRFSVSKGVDVILRALPKEGDWVYLMMGSGSEEETNRLRSLIKELGLEEKVIETGFVDWYEMTKYWNAVDCAIHVPLTTAEWEETFSLSIVQPMITQKPVIGDDSGSVPYQVGFQDMIVPENDVDALSDKIKWVLAHKAEAKEIGRRMCQRTRNSFEVKHLNDLFYDTLIEDIIPGRFDYQKADMSQYKKRANG